MSVKKIHYLLKRRQAKSTETLIPLKEYAASQFVDESTVRGWIARRKITGHKFYGRWWIEPESRFKVPLYDD